MCDSVRTDILFCEGAVGLGLLTAFESMRFCIANFSLPRLAHTSKTSFYDSSGRLYPGRLPLQGLSFVSSTCEFLCFTVGQSVSVFRHILMPKSSFIFFFVREI